jgi:hypothetical protein
MYVRYIFLISILFLTRKNKKSHNILAQNTRENNADFDYLR